MVTPGPVSPLQSPSFVQTHPCCPAPYYKCQRILIWLRVTKSSLRQCLCTTLIKKTSWPSHMQQLDTINISSQTANFLLNFCLSFVNDINYWLKHHGGTVIAKTLPGFEQKLINAAPLMNALLSFRNKLLKQFKYSWEPFRPWLL